MKQPTVGPMLSALRRVDVDQWRRIVRHQLIRCGTVPAAALELHITRNTLYRWLREDLRLSKEIDLPSQGER